MKVREAATVDEGPYRTTVLSPPEAQPPEPWFRTALLGALCLLALDGFATRWMFGTLLLVVWGSFWFLVRGVWLLVRTEYAGLRRHGRQAAFVFATFVVSSGLMLADSRATRRGEAALIRAVEQYRAREGRYPERLEQLVPRDLSHIPRVGIAPWAGSFGYDAHQGDATLRYYLGGSLSQRFYSFNARRRWGLSS